jgi:hypothetical protein
MNKYPLGNASIVNQKPTKYDKRKFGTNEFWGKLARDIDNRKK